MRSATSFDLTAPDRKSAGLGHVRLADDLREDLGARLEHAVGLPALGLAGPDLAALAVDPHGPLGELVVAEREVVADGFVDLAGAELRLELGEELHQRVLALRRQRVRRLAPSSRSSTCPSRSASTASRAMRATSRAASAGDIPR